ncbi:Uncharacterised protein [uncultured archaeon]|nr:Uncharacterised protein [uncultured archaeon]
MDAGKYGHWKTCWEFDPNDFVGFVYRIVDIDTHQEYIGKKFFSKSIKKRIKGKKNRKIIQKESDWKTYTGSCHELNDEIEQRGENRFQFCILSLHESRASLAYREVELQVKENVVREKLPNGIKKYYNQFIAPIKFKIPDETDTEKRFKVD